MSRRSEVIFEAVTELKDDLIEAAQTYRFVRKRGALGRWAALAACLAVVIGLGALIASGGMGGTANNGAAADGGDAGGGDTGSWGATQENGAAADAESPTSEISFTDPAGPILPLTLREQNDAVTAERTVALDFTGYGEDTDAWEDRWRIGVTDHYTLTNSADTDQTVTLFYPVAGNLRDLDAPAITVDGRTAAADMAVGVAMSREESALWENWAGLLADEGYLSAALDGPEELSGMEAIVYTVSGQQGPAGEDAATLALEFTYDPAKTTVLQYGFDGMSRETGDVTRYAASGFVSAGGDWLLIVLGEDIENPRLQGYEDGGCDPGEELSTVTGALSRRETTLAEVLRQAAADSWDSLTGGRKAYDADLARSVFLAAVEADQVWRRAEQSPTLEQSFTWSREWCRVVWFTAEVTIPAGGSVEVEAAYTKAASLNSGPPDMADKNLCGYELLPYAGSNLTFIGQTALVVGEEAVPGWYGSLSFGETVLTGERYALYTYQ